MTDPEQRFLDIAGGIAKQAGTDATGGAIIAAVHLGIASDSRSLSNRLGIAHALVLREIATLSGPFITIEKRDTRTQRTFISLTSQGAELAARVTGADP